MEFVAYLWTARATLLRNGLQIASVRSCQQLVPNQPQTGYLELSSSGKVYACWVKRLACEGSPGYIPNKHEPWGRPLTKQVKWGQLLCCPHRLDTIQLRITTLDPVVVVVMLLLVFLEKCLIFLSHFSKVNVVYSCVGCRMSLCSVCYENGEWIYLLLIQNGQSSCLLSIASKRVISAGLCWKLVTLSTSLRC